MWRAIATPLSLKHPSDNPAIGLILCKSKAEFRHLETSIAELEAELGATEDSEIAPDPSENLPRRRRSRGVQKYFRAHNH